MADASIAQESPITNDGITSELENGSKKFWWTIVALILPMIAAMPMLYLQAKSAVFTSTFRYVFAIIPLAILCYVFFGGEQTYNCSKRRSIFVSVVICFTSLIFAVGIFLYLPPLVQLGLIGFLYAWSLVAFGYTNWGRLTALAILLCLAIPAATGITNSLLTNIDYGQGYVTSRILDAVRVPNFLNTRTNSLQTRDSNFELQWMLGRHFSIFAALAFTQLFVVVRRSPFIVGFLSLLSTPVWVVLIGALHLLAAIALRDLGNLSPGETFIKLPLQVVFALICLGMIWSTMTWLSLCFESIPTGREIDRSAAEATNVFNALLSWPNPYPPDESEISVPKKTTFLATGFSVLMLGMGCLTAVVLMKSLTEKPVAPKVIQSQSQIDSMINMPEKIDVWSLTDVKTLVDKESKFASFSKQWTYQTGNQTLVIAIDLDPSERKAAWDLIGEEGWKIQSVRSSDTGGESREIEVVEIIDGEEKTVRRPAVWPATDISMRNSENENLICWVSFFDDHGFFTDQGSQKDPGRGFAKTNIIDRLTSKKEGKFTGVGQIRVQLYTPTELSPASRINSRRVMSQARSQIYDQALPIVQKIAQSQPTPPTN